MNNINYKYLIKRATEKNINKKIINYIKYFPNDSYFHSLLKIKNAKKFRKMLNLIIKILDNLELINIKRNEIIFYYNDIPDYLYFTFSGEVGILVPNKFENNLPKDFFKTHENNKKFNKEWTYNLENILKIGSIFGEISLNEEGFKRTATCYCHSKNLILGRLNKEKYIKFLKEIDNENIYKLFRFYNSIFQNSFSINQISLINLKFKKKLYKHNQIILKQNSKIELLYIVKKGKVNLYEEFNFDLINLNTENDSNINNKNYLKFLNKKIKLYNNKVNLSKKVKLLVKTLYPGDTIGINEFNNNINNNFYSIVSSQENTKIYSISFNNLDNIIINNLNLRNCLKKSSENYDFYFKRKQNTIDLWKKNLNVLDNSSLIFLKLNNKNNNYEKSDKFKMFINKYESKLKSEQNFLKYAKNNNKDLLYFDYNNNKILIKELAKFKHNIKNDNFNKRKNFENFLKKFKTQNNNNLVKFYNNKTKKNNNFIINKKKISISYSLEKLKFLKMKSIRSNIKHN